MIVFILTSYNSILFWELLCGRKMKKVTPVCSICIIYSNNLKYIYSLSLSWFKDSNHRKNLVLRKSTSFLSFAGLVVLQIINFLLLWQARVDSLHHFHSQIKELYRLGLRVSKKKSSRQEAETYVGLNTAVNFESVN